MSSDTKPNSCTTASSKVNFLDIPSHGAEASLSDTLWLWPQQTCQGADLPSGWLFTWAQCSASHLGAVCRPGDRWQHLGPFWWLRLWEGSCHRCLVGKGQGCCWARCNTRVSSRIKESLCQSRGGETLGQGDQSFFVYAAVASRSKCI